MKSCSSHQLLRLAAGYRSSFSTPDQNTLSNSSVTDVWSGSPNDSEFNEESFDERE